MIKIIETGKIREARCKSCGALLQYDISDICEGSVGWEYHGTGPIRKIIRRYIVCPQCKCLVFV